MKAAIKWIYQWFWYIFIIFSIIAETTGNRWMHLIWEIPFVIGTIVWYIKSNGGEE